MKKIIYLNQPPQAHTQWDGIGEYRIMVFQCLLTFSALIQKNYFFLSKSVKKRKKHFLRIIFLLIIYPYERTTKNMFLLWCKVIALMVRV